MLGNNLISGPVGKKLVRCIKLKLNVGTTVNVVPTLAPILSPFGLVASVVAKEINNGISCYTDGVQIICFVLLYADKTYKLVFNLPTLSSSVRAIINVFQNSLDEKMKCALFELLAVRSREGHQKEIGNFNELKSKINCLVGTLRAVRSEKI